MTEKQFQDLMSVLGLGMGLLFAELLLIGLYGAQALAEILDAIKRSKP